MSTPDAVAAARPAGAGPSLVGRLRAVLLAEYFVLIVTAVYVAAMAPLVPEILTADTWRDILAAMMPLLVVAIGQTFVLIIAGIDLSAPSILAMASVMGAAVVTQDPGGLLVGRPLGHSAGGRARLPGRRRPDRRPERGQRDPLRHAGLHR